MTAYIAAHLVPFILILAVGTGFYFFIRKYIDVDRSPSESTKSAVAPDWPVAELFSLY